MANEPTVLDMASHFIELSPPFSSGFLGTIISERERISRTVKCEFHEFRRITRIGSNADL
jgi:hypothetical protein